MASAKRSVPNYLPGCYCNLPCERGESLPGYLLRLAEANGYGGIREFLRIADVSPHKSLRAQLLQLRTDAHTLARIGRIAVGDARHLDPFLAEALPADPGLGPPEALFFEERRVDVDALYPARSAVCPACLADGGIAREEWDLAPVTVCAAHGTVLIDACPTCGAALEWSRPQLLYCGQCGADLRGAPAVPASPAAQEVSMHFQVLAPFRVKIHGGRRLVVDWDEMFRAFKALLLPDWAWALASYPRILVADSAVAARHALIEQLAGTLSGAQYDLTTLRGKARQALAPLTALPNPQALEEAALEFLAVVVGLSRELAAAHQYTAIAVWYEGDPGPGFVYQSSSADDAAEPKLSLVPLIFGTFKATLYTMILAVPVAVLAAIFTSEFLDRRVRAVIKPTIETMASLPSVVLGFIAAMVLAPWLVRFLPGVLLALAAVPLAVLLAAHLWHFIPTRHAARAPNWLRALLILAVTIVSAAAALRLGPLMEAALFTPRGGDLLVMAGSVEPVPPEQRPAWLGARHSVTPRQARLLRAEGLYVQAGQLVRPTGATSDPAVAETIRLYNLDAPNLRGWLNSTFGGPWPGWFLITFPAGVILAALAAARFLDPWLRTLNVAQDRRTAPLVELVKFLAVVALGTLLAAAIAAALSSAGLDPRDSIVGTFQQRNTLVVALALAVAVIPIIYTICEDAMASVPDHLRSASLAAGATRWQTAVRVVLPVAMSGVFSATMIGLGRAAGETMIVLMATGNTPIMSMSLFDGMRTLSANIAVELPEAPRDSTHYRVLFLCGLVLFVITFLINTVAEVVRQRYRRRSAEL